MSLSTPSHLATEPETDPTRWWIASLTCVIALPGWALAIAGLQLGVISHLPGGREDVVYDLWVIASVVLGLICALVAWRGRARVRRSGRWAGLAGALVLVGLLLAAGEGSL